MKFLVFAVSSFLVAAAPAQAHGDAHPKTAATAVRKEQKPWGIAGDAKAARRTHRGPDARHDALRRRIASRSGRAKPSSFVVRNTGKVHARIRASAPRRNSTSMPR